MNNLIQDLSTLTTIATYNLDKLVSKSVSIISHDVAESLREGAEVTSIDIGLGVLHIQHIAGVIKYKFIPSKMLDNTICSTYKGNESSLIMEVDKVLGERINNIYKDLF